MKSTKVKVLMFTPAFRGMANTVVINNIKSINFINEPEPIIEIEEHKYSTPFTYKNTKEEFLSKLYCISF